MLGRYSSSARVKDGRLVMSMPDAETPVVWVMDLNDATTSVLRLESDKQGLYVIKKHGGKAAETIAVYRNRQPAVRALSKATRALDNARTMRGQGGTRLTNILLIVLLVWFAMARFWDIDQGLMRLAIYPFIKDKIAAQQMEYAQQMAAAQQAQQPQSKTAQPGAASPAQALGVPVNADDALQGAGQPAGPTAP